MFSIGRRALKSNEYCVSFIRFRALHYVQGQTTKDNAREYFYYIDHQGMLFMDDARMKNFTSCFKEKKFLQFFFRHVKINNTDHYQEEFPFVSPCGREMNYIRCDDLPIVFTHAVKLEDPQQGNQKVGFLLHNHAGLLLKIPFEPHHIFMLPGTGRVYHPAPDKVGGVGLVRSLLAVEFSKHFVFEKGDPETSPPTHFNWDGQCYTLSNILQPRVEQFSCWKDKEET
ncbi:UPF0598 protein CG30010-like [Ornithodoros turicata]|uniref:UPF0598 protein CG30010-like n=1 Tax=Ornithodoros turicata TaxID=34597 RepID=UPI0031399CBA